MMLSVVLLPIQTALITPLRIYRQRNLLPLGVSFALIASITPAFSGVFYCYLFLLTRG